MTCPGIPRKACCETWTFPTTLDEIPPWLRWKLEDPIHHACFSPDQAPGFTVFRFSHLETGPERLTETSDHRWTFRRGFFLTWVGFCQRQKCEQWKPPFVDDLMGFYYIIIIIYHPLWEPLRIPLTIIKRTFPMTFPPNPIIIYSNPKILGSFPLLTQQIVGEIPVVTESLQPGPSPDACGLCIGGAALLRPFVGAGPRFFNPWPGFGRWAL